MVHRRPHESLPAFTARSYMLGARSARGQVIQLMATPFVLVHLAVCVVLGLIVGAVVGMESGAPMSMLGRGFAAGVTVGLVAAAAGLVVVTIADRRVRR